MPQRTSATSFLDLPAELRNEIYRLHLNSIFHDKMTTLYWKHVTSWHTSIQQTCQQVRNEVRPMLGAYIASLDLVVSIDARSIHPFKMFLSALTESTVTAIKSINLRFPDEPYASGEMEASLVLKVAYDAQKFAFSLVEGAGFIPLDASEYFVILGYAHPWPVSICSELGSTPASSDRYEKVYRHYRRSIRSFMGPEPIIHPQVSDKVIGLPLFIRPVIEAWKGKKFTKAGLLKLATVLEVALEEDDEEKDEAANEGTKQGTDTAVDKELIEDQKQDELTEDEDEPPYHDEGISLIVRLPIRRSSFQAFPWGVKVDYKHGEREMWGGSIRAATGQIL